MNHVQIIAVFPLDSIDDIVANAEHNGLNVIDPYETDTVVPETSSTGVPLYVLTPDKVHPATFPDSIIETLEQIEDTMAAAVVLVSGHPEMSEALVENGFDFISVFPKEEDGIPDDINEDDWDYFFSEGFVPGHNWELEGEQTLQDVIDNVVTQ